MKKIYYTFRTMPITEEVSLLNPFIFGKLKEDFESYKEIILKENPDLIIGFAMTKGKSRVEPKAVNKFNTGMIDKDGLSEIELLVPKGINLGLNPKPTTTFCNWTMYKIADFIKHNELRAKFTFIHLNSKDLNKLWI